MSRQDSVLPGTDEKALGPMARTLTVLSLGRPKGTAENSIKLSQFMGIAAAEHRWVGQEWPAEETLTYVPGESACLIANARELVETLGSREELARVKTFLLAGRHALFLYGFSGLAEESNFLKELTGGGVVSCSWIDGAIRSYGVHYNGPLTGQHLDSLNFRVEESTNAVAFELSAVSCGADVLMTVEEKPFLIRLPLGDSTIYLAGCHQIADLDALVSNGVPLLSYFSTVVPLMIFLREFFGQQCWYNNAPKACFILDDPLLKEEYGFVNYRTLLEAVRSRAFCMSVAFIPWNYRRTSKKTANLILLQPDRFSLSIHGCDHSAAEFGSADEILLRYKAAKAVEQMSAHQRISGLPFDEVMVFPQGVFSTIAMKELKSCDYLAAVNSTPYPVDIEEDALTLRELLDVAVIRFSNLPLFVRRYPKDLAELAFDLFLGKPALIVEHHGFFRNGYGDLTEFVDKLNALEVRLEWTTLAKICSSSCLKRVAVNGDVHVQFYADRFCLQNDTDRPQNYLLFRRVALDAPVKGVTINGSHADFEQETDTIKIPLALNPRQVAEVRVARVIYDKLAIPYRQSPIYNSKVLVRRFLSECRDNYVDKSFLLSSAINNVRRLFQRRKHRTTSIPRGQYLE